MKQYEITKLIRTTLTELLNERENRLTSDRSREEKYFKWTDKTGRGEKALKIPGSLIEKTWDLEEEDWTTDQKLGIYLTECYLGEFWETRTQRLECIQIY